MTERERWEGVIKFPRWEVVRCIPRSPLPQRAVQMWSSWLLLPSLQEHFGMALPHTHTVPKQPSCSSFAETAILRTHLGFSSLLGFLSKFHCLWEELSYFMSGKFTISPPFAYFSGGFEIRIWQAHKRIFTSPSACKENQISEPTYPPRCGNLLTVHNMPKLHLLIFLPETADVEKGPWLEGHQHSSE